MLNISKTHQYAIASGVLAIGSFLMWIMTGAIEYQNIAFVSGIAAIAVMLLDKYRRKD